VVGELWLSGHIRLPKPLSAALETILVSVATFSFVIDVFNDGCPVVAPFVSDVASLETELIEVQEDVGLKLVYKSSSLTDFWKRIPKPNYRNLQKTVFDYSVYLGQLTAVNLSSL
jgi:hypothetical protein